MDYQLSDKNSLFGRYLEARRDVPTDYDPANVLSFSVTPQFYRFYSFVLGNTYLIGSNTVSSFHATVNRMKDLKDYPRYFDLADLGACRE